VEPLWIAAQRCIAQHPNDSSPCNRLAQRALDAVERLRPGEGPALNLPALPRETACDPSYWAQRLGSNNAGSQQAATLAVQTMLDLYRCRVAPASKPPQAAPPPQPAASNVLVCEQALDRYRRAFAEARPGADPAVIGIAVEKLMRMIGCTSSLPASNVLACEQALARLKQRLDAANPGADPAVMGMAMEKGMQMIGCMPSSAQ
jgi:hypothetical protein